MSQRRTNTGKPDSKSVQPSRASRGPAESKPRVSQEEYEARQKAKDKKQEEKLETMQELVELTRELVETNKKVVTGIAAWTKSREKKLNDDEKQLLVTISEHLGTMTKKNPCVLPQGTCVMGELSHEYMGKLGTHHCEKKTIAEHERQKARYLDDMKRGAQILSESSDNKDIIVTISNTHDILFTVITGGNKKAAAAGTTVVFKFLAHQREDAVFLEITVGMQRALLTKGGELIDANSRKEYGLENLHPCIGYLKSGQNIFSGIFLNFLGRAMADREIRYPRSSKKNQNSNGDSDDDDDNEEVSGMSKEDRLILTFKQLLKKFKIASIWYTPKLIEEFPIRVASAQSLRRHPRSSGPPCKSDKQDEIRSSDGEQFGDPDEECDENEWGKTDVKKSVTKTVEEASGNTVDEASESDSD